MKIFIIYHKFYELDGSGVTLGGIQTYIQNLTQVLSSAGHTCSVIQVSNSDSWTLKKEHYTIRAFPVKRGITSQQKISKALLSLIYNADWDHQNSLVIWGTDSIAVKDTRLKTISIQHGIGFDGIWLDSKIARWTDKLGLQSLQKWQQRFRSVRTFLKSDTQVCVDYNYLNWIRTMVPRKQLEHVHVIPNFTATSRLPFCQRNGSELKILFARRFSEERGSLVMLDITKQLLKKYSDVQITLAGDGKYQGLFEREFSTNKRVNITKFQHHESFQIHSEHHLALVPTCWSEGTSLSLLEAMTTGCVPIVSNVGGMTNIVLDDFNGKILAPDADAFVEAISYFYENEQERLRVQKNAKLSVDQSFSLANWSKKWLQVIDKVSNHTFPFK